MSFMTGVIDDDSLHGDADGFALDIHIPWYRSLPLSCVIDLRVEVDGTAVAKEDLSLAVNGNSYRWAELAGRHDEFWFVQDALRVSAPLDRPIGTGDDASVTVRLDTRIPYILTGPDSALNSSVQVTRTLTAL